MQRNSLIDMSARTMHQAVRMTIDKINDSPMWQEMDFSGMASDVRTLVERVQSFGMTSVPMPPTQGQVGQGMASAAEGIALFLGGQRNHPVIISVDDRRHRPMGMKPGESAQYDPHGQMTYLSEKGTFVLSTDNNAAPSGGGTGQGQKRYASLRHVEKKAQERKVQPPQGQGGQGGIGSDAAASQSTGGQGGIGSDTAAAAQHKHEGETVNHEVRVDKDGVQTKSGETVKDSYDKGSDKWNRNANIAEMIGKSITNIGEKLVNIKGSQGINLDGPGGAGGGGVTINGQGAATQADITTLMNLITALTARVAVLEAFNPP